MNDEAGEQVTKSAGSVALVVPQLLYDVIARIIPGVFLWFFFAFTFLGPNLALMWIVSFLKMDLNVTKTMTMVIAGGMSCYALSVILWQQFPILALVPERIRYHFKNIFEGNFSINGPKLCSPWCKIICNVRRSVCSKNL